MQYFKEHWYYALIAFTVVFSLPSLFIVPQVQNEAASFRACNELRREHYIQSEVRWFKNLHIAQRAYTMRKINKEQFELQREKAYDAREPELRVALQENC